MEYSIQEKNALYALFFAFFCNFGEIFWLIHQLQQVCLNILFNFAYTRTIMVMWLQWNAYYFS